MFKSIELEAARDAYSKAEVSDVRRTAVEKRVAMLGGGAVRQWRVAQRIMLYWGNIYSATAQPGAVPAGHFQAMHRFWRKRARHLLLATEIVEESS